MVSQRSGRNRTPRGARPEYTGNHNRASSRSHSSNRVSNRASREYRRSQIDYVAPASAHATESEGYSRRISSDGYASIHKKRRHRKILIAVLIVAIGLLLGGGAAALGYLGFLNNQLHADIDDMDALNEALVTNTAPDEPFYMLLMGTDARPGETFDRSDTIILARVDEPQNRVVLLSIPRDTYTYVEGSGMDKINSAHSYGGAAGSVKAVEDFTGVDISHYAEINFSGFVDLVDAVGGVEVDVPMEIDDEDAGGHVDQGLQVLDGEHALIFCRSRATVIGDYQRQANQRVFLQALASKVLAADPATMMNAINSIAACVSTDMNVDQIYSIANKLRGLTAADIYTYTVPSDPELIDGVSYIVPRDDEWQDLMDTIKAGGLPEEQPWDIAGVMADEYNSAANVGANSSGMGQAATNVNRAGYNLNVRNGGGIEGAAGEAADMLAQAGYPIIETGNAAQMVYDDTLVIYNSEADLPVVNDIISILKVGTPVESAGRYDFDGNILVVIGGDWGQ